MSRLSDVLATANIAVDGTGVIPGPNTTKSTGVGFDDWVPWRGFDYPTLVAIFGQKLGTLYRGSPRRAMSKDLSFVNEGTFEDILRIFDIPIVNFSLETMAGVPHFARGSRCGDKTHKPDWSLVSDFYHDTDGRFTNCLPGETKLHEKWWPSMKDHPQPKKRQEWRKVISQATAYMMHSRSRYGFIITDRYLVPLRLTCEYIEPGLAKDRPKRMT